ncbi:MAG: DUF309 domain-containing protein [Myxococcota bacterium]|nr:DUF309 domain-containing protein [Myxococcota bacterium]
MSEPRREIVQADALAWMRANAAPERASVVTSLPDVSELPQLDLAGWRAWFVDAARAVVRWVPEGGLAIFYQSDVRADGALVDKGHLVSRAADEEGAAVLFHKIVCRQAPGTIAFGRPSYSHMIAITRGAVQAPRSPGPDVIADAGHMPWSRAMGVTACRVACRYLLDNTDTRVVVDPFCGRGTVLAVANALGLAALGVDISARRCRAARSLTIRETPDDDTAEAALLRGARCFDESAFFEAHEAWEDRWRESVDDDERRVFQGLVQIAAALHKLHAMGAPDAASRLLAKGLAKLDASPERVASLGLEAFRDQVRACEPAVREARLDRSSVPRILE